MEDNTALECIRSVAATYGSKILQLYEYDANVYGCDVNELRMTPQEYQFMQHKRQLITGLRCFCISLNSTRLEIKITKEILYFYEDKTTDRTSYSYRWTATCESASRTVCENFAAFPVIFYGHS